MSQIITLFLLLSTGLLPIAIMLYIVGRLLILFYLDEVNERKILK